MNEPIRQVAKVTDPLTCTETLLFDYVTCEAGSPPMFEQLAILRQARPRSSSCVLRLACSSSSSNIVVLVSTLVRCW